MSVSGTFDYDPSSPATDTISGGTALDGATVYNGSLANLNGSVGSYLFSDLVGGAIVADDIFTGFTPATDFLRMSFNIAGTGFDLMGFTLSALRIDWIEGLPGISDFLTGQGLPGQLPDFSGRLLLEFTSLTTGNATNVIFNDATVTSVPEPATLSLLATGLLGFGLSRQKRLAKKSET